MDILQTIKEELQVEKWQVEAAVKLIDEGNTPRRNPFTVASLVLGICSMASICTAILPLPLGALGILFAVLAYRKGRQMDTMAMVGIATSCVGLAVSVFFYGVALSMMPAMMRDPDYRDMLNRYSENMYGILFIISPFIQKGNHFLS